jgi:hypothetical protein
MKSNLAFVGFARFDQVWPAESAEPMTEQFSADDMSQPPRGMTNSSPYKLTWVTRARTRSRRCMLVGNLVMSEKSGK